MRPWPFAAGIAALALAWIGPLPALAAHLFAAHMIMHVAVIAVAAPLLAVTIAGGRFDPVRFVPKIFSPVPASVMEFAIVWIWHAPALHQLARHDAFMRVLEQGSFLVAGLFVWLAALGGSNIQRRERAVASVSGLLLTSMHMTLLGVLLAVSGRALYAHDGALPFGLNALKDQHVGGVIMLSVGGAAYLLGALYRVSELLKEERHVAADPAGE